MATSRIKGITIEIGGNTTKLQEALKDVNKQVSGLNSDLKYLDKALKLDPTNTELLAQKQELLAKNIKATTERLETLRTAQSQMGNYNKLTEEQKENYRTLSVEIVKAESALKGLKKSQDDNSKSMEGNSDSVDDFADSVEDASDKTSIFGEVLKANLASDAIKKAIKAVASAMKEVPKALKEWASMSNTLTEQEAKVRRVLQNTTDATEDEIQGIIDLTGTQEKLGVVSQETQLAGLQELGTYVEQKESLEKLLPVMNDMIAQQYGVGASMESASGIATMMGKVLGNGQVDALSRLGYKFDEAQQQVLKFGTEEEKVAVLSEIITQSVGGMNEALAQTDAGKVAIATSYIDDMKKSIGQLYSDVRNGIMAKFLPAVKTISKAISGMIDGSVSIEEGMNQITEGIKQGIESINLILPELLQKGSEILTTLLQGIVNMIPEIMPTIMLIINNIIQVIVENLPIILDAGIKILMEIIKGIGQALPSLIPVVIQCLMEIVHTITDNIELIIDTGIQILIALIDGIVEALPELIDMLPTIIDKTVDTLINNLPKIIEAGTKLIIALIEGIVKAATRVFCF